MAWKIFSRNGWKVLGLTYLLNVAENTLLLLLFGVTITKNTFIGALVFSLALTLLIDKWVLKDLK